MWASQNAGAKDLPIGGFSLDDHGPRDDHLAMIYLLIALGLLVVAVLPRSRTEVSKLCLSAGMLADLGLVRMLSAWDIEFVWHYRLLLVAFVVSLHATGLLIAMLAIELSRRLLKAKMNVWMWALYAAGILFGVTQVARGAWFLVDFRRPHWPEAYEPLLLAIMISSSVRLWTRRDLVMRVFAGSMMTFVLLRLWSIAISVWGRERAGEWPRSEGLFLDLRFEFLVFSASVAAIRPLIARRQSALASVQGGSVPGASLPQALNPTAFISYGGPDEAFARKLYDALSREGVRSFLFTEHAIPGEKLHRTMKKGIAEHDRVVLICSRASLDRRGVLTELEETLAREHRDGEEYLIPIRLDDYVLQDWAPKNFDVAQAVRDRVVADFTGADVDEEKFQAGLRRLIAALRK